MYKTYLIIFLFCILYFIYILDNTENFVSSEYLLTLNSLDSPCIYALDLNECWSKPNCQVLNNLCIDK